MKLTLTRVIRKDTDKEGNPLKTKDGRPYTKIAVQAQEYGKKWLSGFSSNWNEWWREGSVVEADVEENGEYLNLKRPDPVKILSEQLTRLSNEVANLKDIPARVKALEAFMRSPQPGMTKAEEVEDEILPF